MLIAQPIQLIGRYFPMIVMRTPAESAKGVVISEPGRELTADRMGDAPKQAWKNTRNCESVSGERWSCEGDVHLVDNISSLK
jgi:hypothetical protein